MCLMFLCIVWKYAKTVFSMQNAKLIHFKYQLAYRLRWHKNLKNFRWNYFIWWCENEKKAHTPLEYTVQSLAWVVYTLRTMYTLKSIWTKNEKHIPSKRKNTLLTLSIFKSMWTIFVHKDDKYSAFLSSFPHADDAWIQTFPKEENK